MFWRSCCLYIVCTLSVLWWFLNSLSVLSWRRWTACLSPPSRSRWAQVFLWAWCVVLSEAQVILNVCLTRRWRSGAAPRCRARRWRCVFSLLWPSHRTSSCWTPWVRPSLLFHKHEWFWSFHASDYQPSGNSKRWVIVCSVSQCLIFTLGYEFIFMYSILPSRLSWISSLPITT